MKQLHMIVDLQFGSCGKGLFAGYLARKLQPDTVVCSWGPNSGHTFIDEAGNKMVNIALPNGIISSKVKRIMIGPGAIIDPKILMAELERYAAVFDAADLHIHENAAVVTEEHRILEATGTLGIGSTMKGVGEALIQKIRRNRAHLNNAKWALRNTPLEGYVVSVAEYNDLMDQAEVVLLEGAQGFSLSINQGFYPYTTSRDCTKWQLLNDCGIPGEIGVRPVVYGVARTYPIRVANRYRNGEQVGWSGPGYHDQRELKWEEVGVKPELTTVTQLPRRIFTFSMEQIRQAVRMNGVQAIFLNFCNYDQTANEITVPELARRIGVETMTYVAWTGWGPRVDDIKEQ